MPEATTAAATTTTAAATTTTAAAATTAAATTTTAAAAPWHGFAETEKESVAYVTNKGWQGPQDVIKGYQNAEKLIGRDPNTLVTIPKSNDPDGFRAVMSKLGLPETADKYEFDKPDGLQLDPGYETWARGTFHKLGLPASTVKDLTKEHNAYIKATVAQQEKDYQLTVAADKAALQGEWRGGFERMMNAATTAAKALGFDEAMVGAIERQYGYAKTMKFFAGLGQKLGDDTFVGGGGKGGFTDTMTPEEAKVEWGNMQADPVMKAALLNAQHPKNAEAKAKQSKLFAIMYPE